jgi:hypothetical protein
MKIFRIDAKYVRKWLRYASFPFIFKKNLEKKSKTRIERLTKNFEEKFKETMIKITEWGLECKQCMNRVFQIA